MAVPFPADSDERFDLDARGPFVLGPHAFVHPRSSRGRGRVETSYEDLTHLAVSSRAFWIGTRRSVYILGRRAFADPKGPEHAVRAILARIARRPSGAAQLAQMAGIERWMRHGSPLRATWTLAAACLVVFPLQLFGGDGIHEVGYFSEPLFEAGDWWRPLTANLLHALPQFPLHLFFNLIALVVLGTLVERPLGTARSVCIMGAAAAGAMVASAWADYGAVVGVSGVVFGLAGALVWLELRHGARLPAPWRFPRRELLLILGINAALPVFLPMIAGWAHAGGFAGGIAAAALLARPGGLTTPASPPVRLAGTLAAASALAAVSSAGLELARHEDYRAHHASRLARLPEVDVLELNDRAWLIAISEEPTPAQLEAALLLAERAVEETDRELPEVLDTLAEVQFQRGNVEQAVATIDEAIARAPDASYYREQRRRFTGERPASDRPDPPGTWSRDPTAEPGSDAAPGLEI